MSCLYKNTTLLLLPAIWSSLYVLKINEIEKQINYEFIKKSASGLSYIDLSILFTTGFTFATTYFLLEKK
jgi:hypothetical protein